MRDANYANGRELLTEWTGGRKVNHGWGGAMDNGQWIMDRDRGTVGKIHGRRTRGWTGGTKWATVAVYEYSD